MVVSYKILKIARSSLQLKIFNKASNEITNSDSFISALQDFYIQFVFAKEYTHSSQIQKDLNAILYKGNIALASYYKKLGWKNIKKIIFLDKDVYPLQKAYNFTQNIGKTALKNQCIIQTINKIHSLIDVENSTPVVEPLQPEESKQFAKRTFNYTGKDHTKPFFHSEKALIMYLLTNNEWLTKLINVKRNESTSNQNIINSLTINMVSYRDICTHCAAFLNYTSKKNLVKKQIINFIKNDVTLKIDKNFSLQFITSGMIECRDSRQTDNFNNRKTNFIVDQPPHTVLCMINPAAEDQSESDSTATSSTVRDQLSTLSISKRNK